MKAMRFEHSSVLAAPVGRVWGFHVSPGALSHLSPKVMGFKVVDPGGGVANGSLLKAEVGFGPLKSRWHALHSGVEENRGFTDQAVRSPFRYWVHRHELEPFEGNRTRLRDTIWLVPPRWMPAALFRPVIQAGLRALFAWRHRQTRKAVERPSDRACSSLTACSLVNS